MKIVLFLGAGASVPFKKPTTKQLKQKLEQKYLGDISHKFLTPFLNHNKFEDIEHVMQSIKDIKNFKDSLGYEFLSNRGLGLFFHWADEKIRYENFVKEVESIEKILEDEVFRNYAWEHISDDDLSRVYDTIFNKISKHSDEIRIFTTNYDRAIENYCSLNSNHYRCVDGFKIDSSGSRFLWNDGDFTYMDDENKKNNIYLYKLHGSLNWKIHLKHNLERTTEEQKPTDPNYLSSILVYPTMSPKDGHELEPYRTIRENFVKYLQEADACIVIGFSFRDGHINEIFQEFIEKSKPFLVISPTSVENICTNFLNEEIPDYQGKISVKPSKKYENVWCVTEGITVLETKTIIDLAFSLLDNVMDNSNKS